MDLAALVAGDWAVIDDQKTVTLFARTDAAGGFADGVTVQAAQRTAIDRDEAAKAPELLAKVAAAWHLWKQKLSGNVPKVGDVIAHGSTRWTVKSVRDCDEGERYRCACVKERS